MPQDLRQSAGHGVLLSKGRSLATGARPHFSNDDMDKSVIFVVDDNQEIADLVADCLRSLHADVYVFYDPLLCLASVRELKPSLLLTDLQMPRLTGVDLARKVREQSPNCKVCIMSGCTDPPPLDSGYAFVQKPLSPLGIRDMLDLRDLAIHNDASRSAADKQLQ